MVFEVALFFGLVYYKTFVLRVLYWLLSPIVLPATILWKAALWAYAPFLKICGVVVFIYMVLLAVYWLSNTISDPYDLEGSLKAVKKASELANSVLKENERMHIGQYPLGDNKNVGSLERNPNVGTEELRLCATEEMWDSGNGKSGPGDSGEAIPKPQKPEPSDSTPEATANLDFGSALSKLGAAAATAFSKAFSEALEVLKNTDFSNFNWRDGRYSSGRGGFGIHYNFHSYQSTTTTTINGYTTTSYSSGSHSSWSSTPVSYGRLGRYRWRPDRHFDGFRSHDRWRDDHISDFSSWNENDHRVVSGTRFGNTDTSLSEHQVRARRFQDDWDRQETYSYIFMGLVVLIVVVIIWGL
jgi:hypothetical protein